MKKFYLLILMSALVSLVNAQTEYEYDFNNLSIGDLDGQDSWATILHTTGPSDFIVDYAIGNVASHDGTLAVWYNASGASFGRTATRKATSNFDFDLTQSDIIDLEIDMHRNYWGMFFGAGFDADGDGIIAPGLSTEPDDGGIYVNIAAQNPTNNKVVLPNGDVVSFTAENAGWCRYKMTLDFTANDGEGAVALFYDPDITGEWIAIAEVQGVNMGLTPGSGDKQDRTVWDGIFFHGSGGTTGFDNILIREAESSGQPQYIDFSAIPNKLTTDPSFELDATATSQLPVEFEVTEGPATVDGNILTLTGDTGLVSVKAIQPGDDVWAAAPEVYQSFHVYDATMYSADLTVRRPADGTNVYIADLSPIILVASSYIEHPDVLHILSVEYTVSNESGNLYEKSWGTGYYTKEWTPPDFGTYTLTVTTTTTGGMTSVSTSTFEVTNDISDMTVQAFDQVHISTSTQTSVTEDFVFPSFVGSFDDIVLTLDVTCPAGGCDPWDRVGNMEVRGPTGEWVEILRYITPYGVPCDHTINVTDYASLLQGLVEMRFSIGTDAQGFIVDVSFDFQEGTPEYKYSWVDVIWRGTFPFGDYANLQPMDTITWNYAPEAEASKLKIINTGHGWGDLNTGNAAEFYDATHKIKVNNDSYDQHLWVVCNPNPDGCQPQNGTWYYNRAGWCPGSISHVYDYDLTSYVSIPDVSIIYEFYPDYMDYCHPNNPDCVTGVTCDNCQAGFNPHFIISGNLVTYSDNLYIQTGEEEHNHFGLEAYPNPTNNFLLLSSFRNNLAIDANVQILNALGQETEEFSWDGKTRMIDVTGYREGYYFVRVSDGSNIETIRFIVK